MRRYRWTVAILVVAAATVAISVSVASASSGSGALKLHLQGGSSTFVNVAGKKSPAIGDEIILHQPVWQDGSRVGTGIVTISLTGGVTDQLHATLALRGGQIDVGGVQLSDSSRFTLPIDGGSGAYVGASGQVRVHLLHGKGNPTDLTIELE